MHNRLRSLHIYIYIYICIYIHIYILENLILSMFLPIVSDNVFTIRFVSFNDIID